MKKILLLPLVLFATFAMAQSSDTKSDKEIVVKNSKLCLKQDLTRGGAINYISLADRDRNIVNIHDEGRYIQQSYYAGNAVDRRSDGQSDFWTPWCWNPIQVGDYATNRARILEHWSKGRTSYVKCVPMLWDMDNSPAEATMEQWVELKGNVIKVRNRLTCHRTDNVYGEGVPMPQEIPAVYLISSLKHLFSYFGDKPFAGEPITATKVVQIIVGDPEHPWGHYEDISEKWMAFVDDSLWGCAVYTPSATVFTAGRYDAVFDGESKDDGTVYIAPNRIEKLMKDSVMDSEYYLVVGTLEQMRKEIYKINKRLSRVAPKR